MYKRQAQSVDAVLGVAKEKQPNLKISTITGGSGQLLRRIEAEAAKPQADLFWSCLLYTSRCV